MEHFEFLMGCPVTVSKSLIIPTLKRKSEYCTDKNENRHTHFLLKTFILFSK
jgi:hypothetical protein